MKILPTACPWCDRVNAVADFNGASDEAPPEPQPGDVLICESCADFSIYVCPGLARRPTADERHEIVTTPSILREIIAAETRLRK